MPETKIGSAERSDIKTQFASGTEHYFEVDSATTDGPADQKETEYINSDWSEQFGYYRAISELKNVIDAKATWTIGKGFTADEMTELILSRVKGFGEDTFNTILENMIRTYQIGGDAFAEIIIDDNGFLLNLKPLDPGVIKIVTNRKGIIIRYEQINKVKGTVGKIFQPEDIFHLARNRVADEIHGQSMVTALKSIIDARNEAMTDFRRVLHRNVDPRMIYHLDTDNTTEIEAFKAKEDAARGKGENIYIPKNAVEAEQLSIAPNSTLNPITWIEMLDNHFYRTSGVPKIITGDSQNFTDAASKMAYLIFEQTISEEQLFVEEQTLAQLNLVISLEFPASLESGFLSGKPKEEERGIEPEPAAQPNDMTAEMEGRT